eukprot:scaffold51455_cov70-Phaeocystis_antarctica.AAC.2
MSISLPKPRSRWCECDEVPTSELRQPTVAPSTKPIGNDARSSVRSFRCDASSSSTSIAPNMRPNEAPISMAPASTRKICGGEETSGCPREAKGLQRSA